MSVSSMHEEIQLLSCFSHKSTEEEKKKANHSSVVPEGTELAFK